MTLAIGVDIGGTKVAAGVVDTDTGRLVARLRRPTPAHDGDATAAAVVEVVQELRSGHDVAAVGLGVPGFVNRDRDDVLLTPNLVLPTGPLTSLVTEATGLPATLENDANAAAWGEHRFGAGTGHDHLLLVTVGTGIGGGLVIDGTLHRGEYGVAAEIGHLRIVPDGRQCGCSARGCWEAYGSGTALTEQARGFVAAGVPEADLLATMVNGSPEALHGGTVTAAARKGDPLSLRLLSETGRWLGEGIASLVAVLDPGVVVVGGGLSDAGDLLMQPLRKAVLASVGGRQVRPLPPVRVATLGNDAGVVGAADLACVDLVRDACQPSW